MMNFVLCVETRLPLFLPPFSLLSHSLSREPSSIDSRTHGEETMLALQADPPKQSESSHREGGAYQWGRCVCEWDVCEYTCEYTYMDFACSILLHNLQACLSSNNKAVVEA